MARHRNAFAKRYGDIWRVWTHWGLGAQMLGEALARDDAWKNAAEVVAASPRRKVSR